MATDALTSAVDIQRAIFNFFGGGDQAKWDTVAAQIATQAQQIAERQAADQDGEGE